VGFGHPARVVSAPGHTSIYISFDLIKPMTDNLKEKTWDLPACNDGREGCDQRFAEVTSGRLIQQEDA
jgi:hypothetical protein